MDLQFGGLVGLFILVIDVWAILKVLSSSAPTPQKLLWVLLIALLPVVGLVLWALLGPDRPAIA